MSKTDEQIFGDVKIKYLQTLASRVPVAKVSAKEPVPKGGSGRPGPYDAPTNKATPKQPKHPKRGNGGKKGGYKGGWNPDWNNAWADWSQWGKGPPPAPAAAPAAKANSAAHPKD